MKKGYTELHLHLDGSLSLNTVKELMEMQGMEAPADTELRNEMSVSSECRDLNEYLTKFDFPCSLLKNTGAIRVAVRNLLAELKALGVTYAEIRFAPAKLVGEFNLEQVVEAATEGLDGTIPAGIILCCMRGDTKSVNRQVIETAGKFLGRGVCGVDLAGAEALFPTSDYADIFMEAGKLNIPITIHAGEAAGPESIWQALRMGATRVGHGVRAVEDAELMKYLAEHQILLELCPTSNINTCVFNSLNDYPVREFLKAGVPVCINSDNMTVSDTNIVKEFEKLEGALKLSEEEILKLLENGQKYHF